MPGIVALDAIVCTEVDPAVIEVVAGEHLKQGGGDRRVDQEGDQECHGVVPLAYLLDSVLRIQFHARSDRVRHPQYSQSYERSHGGHDEALVEPHVDDAPGREYPAEVEVEQVDAVQEGLVDVRVDDVGHRGKLLTQGGEAAVRQRIGKGRSSWSYTGEFLVRATNPPGCS